MGENNIQATQYAKFMDKEYNESWEDQKKDVNKTYEAFYNIEDLKPNSSMARELKGFEHGGFGPFEQRSSFREPLPEDEMVIGNDYVARLKEYSKRVVLAKTTNDVVIQVLIKDPVAVVTKKLMKAAYKDINRNAADPFNNPSAWVGGDGQPLFSTAHTCSPKWTTGTTWSNHHATTFDLSHDNLVLGKTHFKHQKDLTGSKMDNEPRLLLVPDSLDGKAFEITKSKYNSGNANEQVNQFSGMQYISWNYLDDHTTWEDSDWFLLGDKDEHGLYMWFLSRPGVQVWHDQNTKCIYLDCMFDYAVGYKHPRNVANFRGY